MPTNDKDFMDNFMRAAGAITSRMIEIEGTEKRRLVTEALHRGEKLALSVVSDQNRRTEIHLDVVDNLGQRTNIATTATLPIRH
jgi:hypothetical protein